jgi:hypothetical protein
MDQQDLSLAWRSGDASARTDRGSPGDVRRIRAPLGVAPAAEPRRMRAGVEQTSGEETAESGDADDAGYGD